MLSHLERINKMTGNRRYGFLMRSAAIAALAGMYCLATVAVSGLVMTATSTSAQAKGPHGHMVGHGHMIGHGHMVGHGRRFWHGHWYGYGVGPCWLWTPAGWIWNIAACP
jgi:hypothetical protein